MNELDLARWLNGSENKSSQLSGRTRTYSGTALTDSANGRVEVDLGGDIITEDGSQGIEVPCGPQVKQGDKVLITTVNGSPYVSSVDGWGDYVGAQASFASAYVGALTAREITADRIDATVGYFGDLEAGNITADQIIANQATIDNLDATYATIDRLESDYITADQIDATYATIDKLESDYITADNIAATYATISNLTSNYITADNIAATYATIDTLESDYATIATLESDYATIDELHSDYANITQLDAGYAKIVNGRITEAIIDQSHVTNLSNHYAHIVDGVIDTATISEAQVTGLAAKYATIANLQANYATINELHTDYLDADAIAAAYATISELHTDYLDADAIAATYATISNLTSNYITANAIASNYAQANFANVNNAWVQNGVIKDGAITSAMILSLSANKLTAGTIDASNITVTNLNADNITTGTINGQRIGTGSLSLDKLAEDVYTEDEVDSIVSGLNDRIDGAIETFTGTVVPTLNNAPANEWTTTKLRDQHVGDVYYVVNSQSQQSGYCYRFTKSGSNYSWQLIKDSDVTAALSRLQTAEGKIGTIEQFDREVSSWQSETDDTLTEMQTAHTTLAGRVSDAESELDLKVDQTTYSQLESTVSGHTTTLGSLTTTTETLRTDVNSAQTTANSAIKSSVQLWYSKANTTAPGRPSGHITSNSTAGGDWRTVVPTYNASYPYYFYCYEYQYADGTYGWSSVVYDQATTESQQQARKGVADAAAAQGTANTANTNAANAVSTANTANTNAANAVSTANDANTNASTALSTANTASTNASNAVTTANTANTNASNAVSTANTANTNASNAVSTANSANTTAGNALNAAKSKYATSSTAASQAAKEASCSNFSLFSGADIYVKFNNANTAAAPTLNVNGTGAKTILAADGTALDPASYWKAGETVHFAYNGSNWLAIESSAQEAAAAVASTVTTVSNKVNTVSDTVDQHTQKIGSLESTVATKADGSTVETIQNNLTSVTQDLSGFKTTVSSTYSTKAQLSDAIDSIEVGGRNLLYGTEEWKDWSCTSKAIVSGGILTVTNTDTSAFQRANGWFTLGKEDIFYRPITISFKAKKTDDTALSTLVFQMFTTSVAPKSVTSGNILEGTRYYLPLNTASSDKVKIRNASEINSTSWTNVSITFTPSQVFNTTSYTEYDYLAAYIGISNKIGSAQFKDIKAEFDTIATDWTPAPEDMATSDEVEAAQTTANDALARAGIFKIDTYQRVFTTAQWQGYGAFGHTENWVTGSNYNNSKIRIGDTAYITGTVSDGAGGSATIIGTVTVVNGANGSGSITMVSRQLIFGGDALYATFERVVQAETKIDQNDEAITLTASKLDSLQVGGRNLIAHTGDEPHLAFVNAVETSDVYAGTPVIQMTGSTSVYRDLTISRLYILYKCRPNMDVVLSFWAKSSSPKESVSYFYNGSNSTTSVVDASMETYRKGGLDGAIYYTIGSDWAKYWIHWKLSENTTDEYKSLILCRLLSDADPTTVQFAAIKFEEGTRPTDWTPAPEDMATAAELRVANNEISSKVSSSDYNGAHIASLINQSASTVKIQAQHVEIDGTTVFTNTGGTATTVQDYLNGNYDAKGAAIAAVTYLDTRNDNQPPSWYFANYPKRSITEFKLQSVIGLSDSMYCYMTTDTPWSDSSGGYPVQKVQTANKEYYRIGMSNSEWGSWQEDAAGGRNLLLANGFTHTPTAYRAYIIPTSIALNELEVGDYLAIQFWGVSLDSNSVAIIPHWGGGSIALADRYVLPDSNGYWSYIYKVTEAHKTHANAANKFIHVYNFVNGHSGSNLTISKWKIERGNKFTDWTPAPEDVDADISAVSTVANAAAPKANAVARTQRIYYRKTSVGSPGQNNTWLTSSGNGYGNWSLSVPQLTYNDVKYPYLYTAVQTQTVAQQASGATTNNCGCSNPLLDESTTIIDGGSIITGTIDANKVTVTNIDADEINTGTLDADLIAAGSLSISKFYDLSVGGRNLLLNSDQSISGTNNNKYNAGTVGSDVPAGTILVASVHVKATDLVWSGSGTRRIGFELAGNQNSQQSGYQYIGVWTQEAGTYNKRISQVWTLTGDLAKGHAWGIYIQNAASGTIEVSNPKLEIGTVPTDWTPAPEDMVTNASFDVQNGKIVASVQSLAAGNSTYTDPSGNSVASGIGTKIEQTASDLTVTIASGTSYYATSTTAAGTAAKTATTMRDTSKPQAAFDLVVGVNVRVLFANANTVANPTLNVDNKGAKPIRVNNAAMTATSPYNWAANTIVTFVYDGTYWQMSEATALGIASAGKATADELATIVRVYSGGVLVGKSGNTVGALVSSSGSFDVVPVTWSGTTPTAGTSPLASFGSSTIKLGSSGYNMELTSSALTFKNGTTTLQQITGTANTMYVSSKKRMVLNSTGLTLYDTDGSSVMTQMTNTTFRRGKDSSYHVIETLNDTTYLKTFYSPGVTSLIGAVEGWSKLGGTSAYAGSYKYARILGDPEDLPAQVIHTVNSDGGNDITLYGPNATNIAIKNKYNNNANYVQTSFIDIYPQPHTNGDYGNDIYVASRGNMIISSGEFARSIQGRTDSLLDGWSSTGETLYLASDGPLTILTNTNGFLSDPPVTPSKWFFRTDGQIISQHGFFDRSSTTAPSTTTNYSDFYLWRDVNDETIGYVGPWWPKATSGRGDRWTQLCCRTDGDANNCLSLGFDANDNRVINVSSKPPWHSGLGLYSAKALSSTAAFTINSACSLTSAYLRASYASVVTITITFKVTDAQNNGATVTVGTIPATATDDNIYSIRLRPQFTIRAQTNRTNCLAAINSSGVVTFWNGAGSAFAAGTEHVITATYVTGN